MSVSKRARFEIFKRDGFMCLYCGRKPPEVTLEVDHMIAKASGGGDDTVNLVTSCVECNQGKSDRPLTQIPHQHLPSVAERHEKIEQLRALAELTLCNSQLEDEQWYLVSDLWMKLQGEELDKYELSGRLATAVRRFLKLLPLEEVLDAVKATFDNTNGNDRYFYGVCRRKIERRKNPLAKPPD